MDQEDDPTIIQLIIEEVIPITRTFVSFSLKKTKVNMEPTTKTNSWVEDIMRTAFVESATVH